MQTGQAVPQGPCRSGVWVPVPLQPKASCKLNVHPQARLPGRAGREERGPAPVGLLGAGGLGGCSRPLGLLSLVSIQLSAWSCPSPPQRWQADSDLHRACGPLNEGWPLLVIKISEETLKRKPLGQGLRGPRLLSQAKGQDSPPGSGRRPSRAADQHSWPHPSPGAGGLGRGGCGQKPPGRGGPGIPSRGHWR